MTKILYVSSLCSERLLQYIYDTAEQKPEQAAQKFHRLLAQGFTLNPDNCLITTLSTIPVTPFNHTRRFWFEPSEKVNHLKFCYIPMLNMRYFKNIGVFVYTFFTVLLWGWFRIGQNKMILCDVLNFTVAFASFLAGKLSFTKNITIVTDLPDGTMLNGVTKKSPLASLYHKTVNFMLCRFDGYILLTEQMNEVVNPANKPYMILEGLVDINMQNSENILRNKAKEKILIYAGGLYEQYGVKMLIDGFQKVKEPSARLHLYGNGEMVKDIEDYTKKDPRIVYKGMVPNKIVVADQLAATLLINPRPSTEEFTKFSFPSKNMEYMVSGTPMVTTKLPGMPSEYLNFVYIFEIESIDGIHKTLEFLLTKNKVDLHNFGTNSKGFVMENKNNKIQAKRILRFFGLMN